MVTKKIKDFYTLKKCKKILRQSHQFYQRKRKSLEVHEKEKIESFLLSLQRAILEKNASLASQIAHQLEESAHRIMPKTLWDKTRNFVGGILFALVVAIAVRQMWFELYTIPTGSMRPTLKESDFLFVSKTDYGINIPLTTGHFYFDPALVQRGDVFVFTSEDMDIADSDTMYFYIFPGKKQMVKRLIAKPGDTLYFYGGELYGIDAQGKDLAMIRDPKWFQEIEHIPFIRFDGKVETPASPQRGVFPVAVFYQMNEPIAKMEVNQIGVVSGEMLAKSGKAPLANYFDLWGFKNYAMARLLSTAQVDQIHPGALRGLEKGTLYLELTHHPDVKKGHLIRDMENRMRPDFTTSVSLLPLQKEHISDIFSHMTTCRFQVREGLASRLGMNPKDSFYVKYYPKLEGVPDGTYEFQNGKAYQIYFAGIAKELPPTHPLYDKSPEKIQLLYNLGIEFLNQYAPVKNGRFFPSRYAYFRNGDLYLLGAPIVMKEDPALVLFLKREYQKQSISTSVTPYYPFEDLGPPLTKEGAIDAAFIRKFGLKIPERSYLALGDNHAMSADSRQFGFVPQENIRGGVGFLFWPPGPRWGRLLQPLHPHLNIPNFIIWGAALAIALIVSFYLRKKLQKPMKF